MNKDELDSRREEIALEISGGLIGTGISVSEGGSRGPYCVTVCRLNRKDVMLVVNAILAATGRPRREVDAR